VFVPSLVFFYFRFAARFIKGRWIQVYTISAHAGEAIRAHSLRTQFRLMSMFGMARAGSFGYLVSKDRLLSLLLGLLAPASGAPAESEAFLLGIFY
jgi:hypothetical protein